ncbi:MAG: hypothetical protein ACR2ND_14230 [Solirubrobacteraceae bacterium]
MRFEPARLRRGELIVGASAIVLLAVMLLLEWYGLSGQTQRSARALGVATSVNGWHGLKTLRWLMLVTIAAALALAIVQGVCRPPALPVSLSVIVTVLSGLTSLALIYRVLISVPGPSGLLHQKLGAYLGLVSAFALTYGAFRSLREEAPRDAAGASIPAVKLGGKT